MPSYNLVDEPWLSCIMPDGSVRDYGLRDLLLSAHEIRELFDPSPLVTVSLHRLLLAILHRSHNGPESIDAWADLWRQERWTPNIVGAYLDRWRHRFHLFDSARPFYQSPDLGETEKRHPVSLLAQEVASGNNATLFDHHVDDTPQAIDRATAARLLVATQAYSLGGGVSKPFNLSHSPLSRGYSVLLFGDNLFQTLALNLVPYNEERPIPRNGDDQTAWENENVAAPHKLGTPASGYLDYLTWQSRRIRLIIEDSEPGVRWCYRQQNLKLADGVIDPFKMYLVDPAEGLKARGLSPTRAVWRDSHTLFQVRGDESQRPEVFQHLAAIERLRQRGRLSARPRYSFGVFGVATDAGKAASVVLWRQERLPLPLAYLTDEDLVDRLKEVLDLAHDTAKVVTTATRILAQRLLSPDSDDRQARQPDRGQVQQLVDHLGAARRYWARLEVPFNELLVRLPNDRISTGEEADYGQREVPRWAAQLRRAARDVFAETTRGLDGSARSLKAVTQAERYFHRELGVTLHDYLSAQEETNHGVTV